MNRTIKLEGALACANLRNFQDDIQQLDEAKIDYFHFDIMDGWFVPNFALDFSTWVQ